MYLKDEGVKHRDRLMAAKVVQRWQLALWPSSAEVVCRQQRGKQSEEESEVGETNGDPVLKGTTPTEPGCDIIQQMRH